jgi:hypothetical protein
MSVSIRSTYLYSITQLSEQNQLAAHNVELDNDPAELGSVPDGNSVRDSHDDPWNLSVHDEQCETTSGSVFVVSPLQDIDSDLKVLRNCVQFD